MNFIRENTTLILSVLFTIALAFISELHILPDAAYIVLAVGATFTFALAFLKKEMEANLREEIKKSHDLYRIVTEIDDSELQNEVFKLARSLASGEVPANFAEHRARNLIKKVTKTVWGSDCRANKQALLDWWQSSTGINWFASNIEAVQRGVRIERHFFLNRHEVVKANGDWDAEVAKLLQDQADNKIDVRVLWLEEVEKHTKKLTKDILKDFVILDTKEVSVSLGQETVIYREPSDRVRYYIELFEEQREFSSRLQDILPRSAEIV